MEILSKAKIESELEHWDMIIESRPHLLDLKLGDLCGTKTWTNSLCGLPVIGSTSVAIPEVIGDAGETFQADDVDALHAILQALMMGVRNHGGLTERGEAQALLHYACSVLADEIHSVYQSLWDDEPI
jgi:glycosyltransferase involved in cell wall biosynthesis